MRASPVTGLLSLFALLCVGLIAGVSNITDTSSLTANTSSVLGVSATTLVGGHDAGRRAVQDGGEKADGVASSTDSVGQGTSNPVIVVPPIITIPTTPVVTTPIVPTQGQPNVGTTIPIVTTPLPVQPNDSAPRVLIAEPVVPVPVPLPQTGVPTNTRDAVQPAPSASVTQETQNDTNRSNERISDIGSSLRQFQREVRRVENTVRERVSREVENALQKAELTTPTEQVTPTRAFDSGERRRRIDALTSKISQDVRTVISTGDAGGDGASDLQPVLKSSLEEIRLLIKADTGVDVDLSPSARSVVDTVAENTTQVGIAREELLARDGLDLYGDSDRDGISNYDEHHIYKTDPLNAFTSGSSLTDGERILLGFNVLTTDFNQVPVESPKVAGEIVQSVFEVHSINVALKPLDTAVGTSTSTGDVEKTGLPAFTEEVTFSGRALPNSFVTLYVFSTPVVVTVKADASGAWSYTLDQELEDGEHELYIATVDAGGRILAKSPSVPFVKRAEAAEFTPLLIPETPDVTPLSLLQSNLTLVGIVAFIVFALIALIILGVLRSGPKEPTLAA